MAYQRRRWSAAVDRWDHHGVVGLESVIEAVIAEATKDGPLASAVDVGAGTGAVALPLCSHVEKVLAVDVSAGMLDRLTERATSEGVANVEVEVKAIEELSLDPASVDLVVSNYALHHLLDKDKRLFVQRAATWLRPGGRLVIGDMMVGRGTDPADRAIFAAKVKVMLARGPAGWWRITKNAWRLATRTAERPIPMQAWRELLESAGFTEVSASRVVAEAGLVSGRIAPET